MANELGYIKIARKIIDNPLWISKPLWWLKVWLYILLSVNFKDSNTLKRGEGLFTREKIYLGCCFHDDKIKVKSIENIIRYLKLTNQITTRKTTHGFIISVINYNLYQTHTSNGTTQKTTQETTQKSTSKTTQKRHTNDTLYNNKNERMKEEVINIKTKTRTPPDRSAPVSQLQDYFVEKLKTKIDNPTLNYGIAGAGFKKLLTTQSMDEIKLAIDGYIRTRELFYINSGYDIKLFFSKYNAFKKKAGGKYDNFTDEGLV